MAIVSVFIKEAYLVDFNCTENYALAGWNERSLKGAFMDECKAKCVSYSWCRLVHYLVHHENNRAVMEHHPLNSGGVN